jgi:hypothetical protein
VPAWKLVTPRTLDNSEVRDYSWPCVLVFVRTWAPERAFGPGGEHEPGDFVPKRLYMPDGRSVPVCVVKVDKVPDDPQQQPLVGRWPMSWLGGGLPILTRVQELERRATAGCLVTDGHLTYVLTARHACGEPGTRIFSRLRGGEVSIGLSSEKQLTRLPFSQVYADFPGRRSYLTLDVGLVRLDDINDWTSNVYGLPAVGHLADVYEQNLTLKLIDQPVVAFGAATGLLEGRIEALFYRYRSVGGDDHVADFLIAVSRRRRLPHRRRVAGVLREARRGGPRPPAVQPGPAPVPRVAVLRRDGEVPEGEGRGALRRGRRNARALRRRRVPAAARIDVLERRSDAAGRTASSADPARTRPSTSRTACSPPTRRRCSTASSPPSSTSSPRSCRRATG